MNTSTIIKAAELFVRNRLNDESTGHDWWHIERVRATGRHLQKSEGGDSFIIDLSLLLHDVGDRKVIHQDEDDYTIATSCLTQQGVDAETTRTIIQIISHMSFSSSLDPENTAPTSIEFQIVQDADRLDAIGAIGVARAFAFGGSRGRQLYNPEHTASIHANRTSYVQSTSSTLHHFDEKLFLLKDTFNTPTAQRIANERDAFLHEFYTRFLDEWNGEK